MARLTRPFFTRDTLLVAKELMGKILVHETNGARVAGRIVETEAYMGWEDAASHASRGKTERNVVMFDEPGHAYVYFIYGRYWLLNFVAKEPDVDYGAAVLIRAVEPIDGFDTIKTHRKDRSPDQWTNGPARLTMAFGINGGENGCDLCDPSSPLYVEWGELAGEERIITSPRVGITVSEKWQTIPWRFYIDGNSFVSRGK